VLVGAVTLARAESGEWPQEEMQAILDKALTRNDDRLLFDLPLIEEPAK